MKTTHLGCTGYKNNVGIQWVNLLDENNPSRLHRLQKQFMLGFSGFYQFNCMSSLINQSNPLTYLSLGLYSDQLVRFGFYNLCTVMVLGICLGVITKKLKLYKI